DPARRSRHPRDGPCRLRPGRPAAGAAADPARRGLTRRSGDGSTRSTTARHGFWPAGQWPSWARRRTIRFMPDWGKRLRSRIGKTAGRPIGSDVYLGLRSMALGVDPATIAVPDGESWSGTAMAAMEIGLNNAIATIVAIGDGSVSMYISTGEGVIGAGGHAAVKAAADRFRAVAADSRSLL